MGWWTSQKKSVYNPTHLTYWRHIQCLQSRVHRRASLLQLRFSTFSCCKDDDSMLLSLAVKNPGRRSETQLGFSENVVYPMTQWFCWSLSLLNGYNWGYTPFSDKPSYWTIVYLVSSQWNRVDPVAQQCSASRRSVHDPAFASAGTHEQT